MEIDSITAKWLASLGPVSELYKLAVLSRAGMLERYYAGILELYDATHGGLIAGGEAAGGLALTAGLPIVTMAGVFVALGSGYAAAREDVRNWNSRTGFAEGFVMGLLGWNPLQVRGLFERRTPRVSAVYELNVIAMNAYNRGLATGWTAAKVLPLAAQKAFLARLRAAADHPSPGSWTRNDQISYVIELAMAGLKKTIIQD
ncbi:MAG TPA: hypothetical protein VJP02_05490 [Candidatus Sulfotelmatobacter sp.]|nr:hypothetical protein [Candidatus Sulfotelmatobacter sp.]